MTWNWKSPDGPDFRWDRTRIAATEKQFLLGTGVAIGTLKHLDNDERSPAHGRADEERGRDRVSQ